MSSEKQSKEQLHPRNRNIDRYDLKSLVNAIPELQNFIRPNKFGEDSINFSDPRAVKLLNKAILHHYYGIEFWEFPDKNLTPPIPGRADYLHYIADLLAKSNDGKVPIGEKVTCLDIGTGASCIYPILGVTEYGWNFIATDIDSNSIASTNKIVDSNLSLKGKIESRLQKNPKNIFHGIIHSNEKIDITICNPPFHSSHEEAQRGTRRKIKNLSGEKVKSPKLNFSGLSNELIYEGGEYVFIQNMIKESKSFSENVKWFTTLVSKKAHLKGILLELEKNGAKQIKNIPMGTGNKVTRVVAWTFV